MSPDDYLLAYWRGELLRTLAFREDLWGEARLQSEIKQALVEAERARREAEK